MSSKVFVYIVTNETTSEYLVGFVVAFVKDYLEIQVELGAVLFQDCIKAFVGLIFFLSVIGKKICSWG